VAYLLNDLSDINLPLTLGVYSTLEFRLVLQSIYSVLYTLVVLAFIILIYVFSVFILFFVFSRIIHLDFLGAFILVHFVPHFIWRLYNHACYISAPKKCLIGSNLLIT
jgi:hypothetical protein